MHTCHAHGCSRRVPPMMFMCKSDWFSLPKHVRDAVWREYRPGQEDDKNPSLRYMAVQRIGVMHTAFKPNDEAAALVCAQYLLEAMVWRQRAIAAGQGDPLPWLPAEEPGAASPVSDQRRDRT